MRIRLLVMWVVGVWSFNLCAQQADSGVAAVPATGVSATDSVAVASQTGNLRIISTPDSVSVTIDDSLAGKTPLDLPNLSAGSHVLKLSKVGYFLKKATVIVAAGSTKELSFSLASPATLIVTSLPAGAAVLIDARQAGTTPFKDQKLKPANYSLSVQLAGYQTFKQQVTLSDGGRDSLHVELVKPAPVAASQPVTAPVVQQKKPEDARRNLINRISLGAFLAFCLAIIIIELAGSSS
jgi:hypothetical protein